MKRLTKLTSWVVGLLVLMICIPSMISAQATSPPPMTISLLADKRSYLPNEPIKIQILVVNSSAQDVIARKGFLGQEFHLLITFTDPDGKPIENKFLGVAPAEPGPSRKALDPFGVLARVATVEIIPPSTPTNPSAAMSVMNDAHAYYELTKLGHYTAQVFTSLETFPGYFIDLETEDLLAYLDDPGRLNFDPLTSNEISFDIVPAQPGLTTSIYTNVSLIQLGSGTKPDTRKSALTDKPVYLYKQSEIPPYYFPINFKTYGLIYENVRPIDSKDTDPQGTAIFPNLSQDNYVVIAIYNESQDFQHMGDLIRASAPEWSTGQPIVVNLRVMEKADGKKVPGKTTKRTGSELLITEPEFVLWDSNQELYPFVFETIGDWKVTTSVTPPSGFVTNYGSLTADVRSETEAVQFTITEVGSQWKETQVTYVITHKKKTETIKNKIGVKLSKRLAKEKGLGPYGQTESPGTFKGGRKVGR